MSNGRKSEIGNRKSTCRLQIADWAFVPTAAREAAWARAARSGILAEAEAAPGLPADRIVSSPAAEGGKLEGKSGGNTASGRAYVAPGTSRLTLELSVPAPGEYALGLRYSLDRTIDTLWPLLGECLQRFSPEECRNYFRHAGYSGARRS